MSTTTRAWFAVALLALLGAATLHLLVALGVGHAWGAMVHLMLFGVVTAMIFVPSTTTRCRFFWRAIGELLRPGTSEQARP